LHRHTFASARHVPHLTHRADLADEIRAFIAGR
jgi:hypothetical protein